MKAAVFNTTIGAPEVVEMSIPEIAEDEILLKPMSVGVCGSELLAYRLKKSGPGSYGHEPGGYVARVGKRVSRFKEGDRVFVHHRVPCLVCHYCRKGSYTMCQQFRVFGFDPTAYAEYTRIKARNVEFDTIRLPDWISFDEGCLIEVLSCIWRAMCRAQIHIGDSVFIIGAGFVGLAAMQIARIMGAERVFISDLVDSKLDLARELGADAVFHAKTEDVGARLVAENGGRKADVVMSVIESIKAFEEASKLVDKGGTLLLFGPTEQGSTFAWAPNDFFYPEIRFVPSYASSHIDTHEVAHHLFQRNIRVDRLITHHFPLEKIAEAMRAKRDLADALKIIIHPNRA